MAILLDFFELPGDLLDATVVGFLALTPRAHTALPA
jgi:hypothetical protein